MVTADGIRLDKPADVQHEVIEYFKVLLGTRFMQRQDARASLQQIIRRKVPTHMKEDLVKPILIDEI